MTFLNALYISIHCCTAVDSFNSIVAKDSIVLNLGGLDGLDLVPTYLEKWCMQLWDLAFSAVFKDVSLFKKIGVFADYHGATPLVKRVIYRLAHF